MNLSDRNTGFSDAMAANRVCRRSSRAGQIGSVAHLLLEGRDISMFGNGGASRVARAMHSTHSALPVRAAIMGPERHGLAGVGMQAWVRDTPGMAGFVTKKNIHSAGMPGGFLRRYINFEQDVSEITREKLRDVALIGEWARSEVYIGPFGRLETLEYTQERVRSDYIDVFSKEGQSRVEENLKGPRGAYWSSTIKELVCGVCELSDEHDAVPDFVGPDNLVFVTRFGPDGQAREEIVLLDGGLVFGSTPRTDTWDDRWSRAFAGLAKAVL